MASCPLDESLFVLMKGLHSFSCHLTEETGVVIGMKEGDKWTG